MDSIPTQSFSVNSPLLYTYRAGPWNFDKPTLINEVVPKALSRESNKNFTSVAPASSAF